jgi:hypothetical protein
MKDPIIVKTRKPYDRAKVLKSMGPEVQVTQHGGKSYYSHPKFPGSTLYFLNEHVIVLGTQASVWELVERDPAPDARGPLRSALGLAARQPHLLAGVNPQPILKQAAGSLPPSARSLEPLLKAQAVSYTAELQTAVRAADFKLQLDTWMAFANESAAKEGQDAARKALELAQAQMPKVLEEMTRSEQPMANAGIADFTRMMVGLFDQIAFALPDARVEQQGRLVRIHLPLRIDLPDLFAFPFKAAENVREVATLVQSSNNLMELGLALDAYHLKNGCFPPAALQSKEGKPLLSWRVALLPYLENGGELFKQFKLNEQWDSPHNKPLLARMPQVYFPKNIPPKESHTTFYQVFTGPGTVFDGPRGVSWSMIQDGHANTILVVEGGTAVPWTKPEDLPYVPGKALPQLGGLFPDGFHAMFCDGSVRFIRKKVDDKVLHALITRNGGEKVDVNELP